MTLEDFLNATREVAKLRWPAARPALGLPVQRPIGKRNGVYILWPVSNATPNTLDIVELEGARFRISSVAQYITSSLEAETEACSSLAKHLDWQSRHIRETQRQTLEALEHEASAIVLAGIGDLVFVPDCLMPLTPIAVRIQALHRSVPVSRVNDLVNLILRREIYPASVSVKAEIASQDIEVRFWQNFRFGWIALRCSAYYKEKTNIYLVYINEEKKEIGLDASLSAVVHNLAEIAQTPDEAVSLLKKLDLLLKFFTTQEGGE